MCARNHTFITFLRKIDYEYGVEMIKSSLQGSHKIDLDAQKLIVLELKLFRKIEDHLN